MSIADRPARIATAASDRSLERGSDIGKDDHKLGADTLHHGDDRHRDAGCNEAVLDGRRTRLFPQKSNNEFPHGLTPSCLSEVAVRYVPAGIENHLRYSTWLFELY